MSNFGASFRKARESSGLPLEKIAAETRISSRFLTAIENEDFHLLPGGVFNRGFIRTFAEHIGLDPEQALADYDRISIAVEEPVEVLRNVERASMRRSERSLYPIAAGLLLVLIVAFYMVTRNGSARSAAEPAPAPVAAEPIAAVAEPVPVPVVETQAPAPAAPVPTPAATTPPAAILASPPAATLVLDVDVKDLTWIKVTTDGAVTLNDNLPAGTKQRFTAASSLTVIIGNAGGAGFKINGRDMPALGKTGEVREFTITPENASTIR